MRISRDMSLIEIRIRQRSRISRRGCYLYPLHGNQRYGKIKIGGHPGKTYAVHRLMWVLQGGFIPIGLNVLHKCDVTNCWRKSHLFIGTQSDNVQDMVSKNRGGGFLSYKPKGERHPSAKLTNAKVLKIRGLKGTYQFIASKFGCSSATICNIKKRKSWSHL